MRGSVQIWSGRGLAAAAFAALLLAAGSAGAAALPVEVGLELAIAWGNELAPIGASGAGVAQVNGSGPAGGALTQLGLPANLVTTAGLTTPIPTPGFTLVEKALQLTVGHGAGSFAAGPGGFGGVMGLTGLLRVCFFQECSAAPLANLSVPLDPVGVGGTAVRTGFYDVTVTGGPWTTGMVAIAQGAPVYETGFVHGPASGTSSVAAPGGVVQLVAPMYISTNRGADALLPAIARLRVAFVPEPGSAALLALGALALGAAGGWRARG